MKSARLKSQYMREEVHVHVDCMRAIVLGNINLFCFFISVNFFVYKLLFVSTINFTFRARYYSTSACGASFSSVVS